MDWIWNIFLIEVCKSDPPGYYRRNVTTTSRHSRSVCIILNLPYRILQMHQRPRRPWHQNLLSFIQFHRLSTRYGLRSRRWGLVGHRVRISMPGSRFGTSCPTPPRVRKLLLADREKRIGKHLPVDPPATMTGCRWD
jgi:hypothetical protein